LISSPERVSPEWLTAALRASGAAPAGTRVTSVEPIPIGAGKVGRCVRFRLTWSGTGPVPPTVVGKFPAVDDHSRRTGVGSAAYRREALFYRHLAPVVRMSIPRCHLAELDPTTGEFAVLMSDAAPARTRDQLDGATPDDVALAIEELVRLQAPFWGGAGLYGHAWLPIRGAAAGRRLAAIYRLLADRFVESFGPLLSARALGVLARFGPRVRRWAAADRPPLTLLHGDFRLDNLLFGNGGGDGAAPLTVVDWQTVTVGSGPSDVAYLIGGGLPVAVRQAAEEDLFRLYRRSLRAAGVVWSEAECRRSYVVNTLAGLHMTVVGAMLVGRDSRSDAMFLSMAERHAAHVDDLDAFDLLDREPRR
jgi:Phosphotransferase enzyme family